MRRRRQLVALGLVWTAFASPPAAQDEARDWSTLTVSAGPAVPLTNPYGDAWALRPGGALRVEAPAWRGGVHASLWVFETDPRTPDVPGFLSVVPAVGWGTGAQLARVSVSAGGELGIVHSRFEREGGFGDRPDQETEVFVGAYARADAPIAGRIRVWSEAGVRRIAYADAAVLPSLAAGLAIRLDTPSWLRRALAR